MSMNSHGSAAPAGARLKDVGHLPRRRVAYRLLPFVFLLYIVNYVDRVNASFANLRMSADLGFSDRVYGLGVGVFYITYVLFEIPGAIIVERWEIRGQEAVKNCRRGIKVSTFAACVAPLDCKREPIASSTSLGTDGVITTPSSAQITGSTRDYSVPSMSLMVREGLASSLDARRTSRSLHS
jgi:hypothetical protein